MRAKKILNDPRNVVGEALEGLVAASRGTLALVDGATAVVNTTLAGGKVGLLIGGGSGHEPLFPGFVGEGLADGAACGHVFAAPAPDVILTATRAVDRGKGVLYVYGNYAGDNLSFDMAAELASDEGISTRSVRVWDDVAAAPPLMRIASMSGVNEEGSPRPPYSPPISYGAAQNHGPSPTVTEPTALTTAMAATLTPAAVAADAEPSPPLKFAVVAPSPAPTLPSAKSLVAAAAAAA